MVYLTTKCDKSDFPNLKTQNYQNTRSQPPSQTIYKSYKNRKMVCLTTKCGKSDFPNLKTQNLSKYTFSTCKAKQ